MATTMELTNWKKYPITDLFTVSGSKTTKTDDLSEYGPGRYPYVTTKATNNGVEGFFNFYTELGNCLTVDSAVLGFCSYQRVPFSASDHVEILRPKFNMTENVALFLCTVINFDCYRFSYGRKRSQKQIKNSSVFLPATDDGKPNWAFMEAFIERLKQTKEGGVELWSQSKTSIHSHGNVIPLEKCRTFSIDYLFDIKYGINMELNALEETTSDDPDGVAFVARTGENNGVSAYVKKVDGKTPQSAGTITVAGGGSVLSTFVQSRPFYSGRDLYLLIPKFPEMTLFSKLYICTVIKQNKYKYSYGRQANKTLPSIQIFLPSKKDGTPDFKKMDEYIKSVPFSDKVNDVIGETTVSKNVSKTSKPSM